MILLLSELNNLISIFLCAVREVGSMCQLMSAVNTRAR